MSYRVMLVSMATGQTAGVCAALAASLGKPPRAIPVSDVQIEITRQGANYVALNKEKFLRTLIERSRMTVKDKTDDGG